jgi:bacterial leucyl aminopeptidase
MKLCRPILMGTLLACSLAHPSLGAGAGRRSLSPSPGDTIRTVIAVVSADSLESTVRGLEAFRTRYFSNANHRSIVAWIRDRMVAAGLRSVQLDSFMQGQYPQMNVVGTVPGSVQGPEIVVGGHFDSNSSDVLRAPGADDNASGTSAVIEMARAITASGYAPRSTIRFVAFAAEEVGLRGGWDYASKAKAAKRDIRAMLNFDMIGHRLAGQPDRDYYVVWYAGGESLARIDSSVARTYTTLTPVLTTSYRSGSDSYCFAEQGYRAVFHIERDFSPFYHSPNDLSDTLDFGYAAEIARVGLATLIRVDQEVPSGGTVIPASFVLAQNYPNPFNAGTEIRYSVGSTGRVVLTIHDLLGREVARLVDADLTPGSYAVRWAADNVASGVFIGRLSGGDGSGSIRMVHIQ